MEKSVDEAGKGWETWVFHEVRDKNIKRKKKYLFSEKEVSVKHVIILGQFRKSFAYVKLSDQRIVFQNVNT